MIDKVSCVHYRSEKKCNILVTKTCKDCSFYETEKEYKAKRLRYERMLMNRR